MTNNNAKIIPAYVPYKTFRSFLVKCKDFLPTRIDRSFWGETLSGGTGGMLMASLNYFALIDEKQEPSPQLRALVDTVDSDGEAYRSELTNLLQKKYEPLFGLDLARATNQQFMEVFRDSYGAGGTTVKKCIGFFVQACSDAGIELSPLIVKGSRSLGAPSGERKRRASRGGAAESESNPPADQGRGAPDVDDVLTGLDPVTASLLRDLSNLDYMILAALRRIPVNGASWTAQEQTDFLSLFESTIKVVAPAHAGMLTAGRPDTEIRT